MTEIEKQTQKEIREMAKQGCKVDCNLNCFEREFKCKAFIYAKRFYDAGYRKYEDIEKEAALRIFKTLIGYAREAHRLRWVSIWQRL